MKAFALKLSLFLLILLVGQVTVSAFYPPELPAEILQLEAYLEEEVDIIYFGDSTVSHPVEDMHTGEFLQDLLPDEKIGEVAHPAYNLDLYLDYVEYILASDHRPAQVIFPINMRSFSPEWDLRPGYQFTEEKAILTYGLPLSTIFYKPLDTLGGFDPPISQKEFLETTVYNGDEPIGTVADFEALTGAPLDEQDNNVEFAYRDTLPAENDGEAMAGVMTYYYLYDLSPEHRKIQSLLQIIDLLQENEIEPIFYITPINYELGLRHIGEEFETQLARNTTLVEEILEEEDVEVLNLVFGLEAYHFVDTEHMRESGKVFIAEQLAQAIDPAAFQPVAEVVPTATLPPTPTNTRVVIVPTTTRTPTPSPTSTPTLTPTPTEVVEQLADAEPMPTSTSTPTPTPTQTPTPTLTPTPPEPEPEAPAPTPTNTRVLSAAVDRAELGRLVSAEYITTGEPVGNYAVDKYQIQFQTLDENENVVTIRADLFFPSVAEATEFPVLVYGAGTTGLDNGCGPLDELGSGRNWGLYNNHMYAYAAQGYIGILPNWVGFDDPVRTHPYFIAEVAGRTMLDSARAVYRFFEEQPNIGAEPMEAVFFGGYSSGGHAAFAAKDQAAAYAPDVPVAGIVGHGPTTNLEVLMRENPLFTPYAIYAYREFYGSEVISQEDVFLPEWLPTFDQDVLNQCIDEVFAYYSYTARNMYAPSFNNALYSDGLGVILPEFKAALDANASGLEPAGSDIPVLILQGTADTVVSPPSQAQFATALCSRGNSVTYLTYPAVSHPAIRHESFSDTIAWMDNIAAGLAPQSDCASLLGQ